MKRKEALSQYKWDFTHLFANQQEWEKELTFKLTKLSQYLRCADLDLTDLSFQNLTLCTPINVSAFPLLYPE